MEQDAADWLEISGMLLRELKPRDAGMEIFGHGLKPAAFAALVDSETVRVDRALVAMATAAGPEEVKALFAELKPDTVICLFSRWAQYQQSWKTSPEFWRPASRNDWWRAILLSMTGENVHSTAAARSLWPAEF